MPPIISFQDFLFIVAYLIPGYITISMINVFTDYLQEKYSLERIIGYLIFSFLSYTFSLITLFLIYFIIYSLLSTSYYFYWIFIKEFFERNFIFLILFAIIYSFPVGWVLGKHYFKKGYPFKHFNNLTKKRYSPSVFAEIEKYGRGYLTFHLRDGTVVEGEALILDRDEDKRDYVFSIKKGIKYFPDGTQINLKGDKILINSKSASLIEFKK